MRQNQTLFHGTYSNLTQIIFYQKILKYFNDFQNQVFSVLWLKGTQKMEMKENLTFFHGTYSSLTVFFSGCKILKYFNGGTFLSHCESKHNQVK